MIKLLIFVSFLFTNVCLGQVYNQVDSRTQEVIDSVYNRILKKQKVVGASIAIVDNGKIVYATGYGFADQDNGIKADENTVYRIGSCTKSFTALSILNLGEEGLVDVEQGSLLDYIPELGIKNRFQENPIYLKDIMSHISGLPSDMMNGFFSDKSPSVYQLISELNGQTLIAPRLHKAAYSNIGYALLGEVIERAEKGSYEDYLRKHILEPLNMNSTYIEPQKGAGKYFSKAYFDKKEMVEPEIRDIAAGFIHSNVLDMTTYIQMYLNDGRYNNQQIVSAKSIQEMETNRMEQLTLADYATGGYGYGLSINQLTINNGQDSIIAKLIGHNGSLLAFHADFKYIPELGVGAVMLTNTDKGRAVCSASKLLRIYLEQEKGIQMKTTNIYSPIIEANLKREKIATFAQYKGRYFVDGVPIDVEKEDKIKFKVDKNTKLVLKKKEDSPNYAVKALLLNFIPVKVKELEVKFVEFEEEIYLKMIQTKTNLDGFGGVKIHPAKILNTWKNVYGKYKVIGDIVPCSTCPKTVDFKNYKLKILEDNGFVALIIKGKSLDTQKMYLNILSDKMAVTHGIGRNTGDTIRVLKNGDLLFHGFQFKKIK